MKALEGSVGQDKAAADATQTVITGIFLLAFFNLPVPLILAGPYGPISKAGTIAFVLGQVLWLERIRRAARSGSEV
jgi:hypothetical protein